MPHRGELKCLADGLIDSFMSRNNDSAGYWALGLLYSCALELQKKTISLTLLGGESTAGDSLCEALRTKYSAFLLERMSRRGIPHHWIESANLTIHFEHHTATAYGAISPGRPFLIQLRVKTTFAKSLMLERVGYCWPHNPSHETRSNRYRPSNEHHAPDA
jgi:hypothetical protein